MENLPQFIDNRNGNSLTCALSELLTKRSHESNTIDKHLSIATAYFSPSGFAQIAHLINQDISVRLLLGSDVKLNPQQHQRRLGETPSEFDDRMLSDSLRQTSEIIKHERDSIPFTSSSENALIKLIELLKNGNIDIRRYEKSFMHAKAYLYITNPQTSTSTKNAIIGSSNLTSSGLSSNLELNLGSSHPNIVKQASEWFNDLWDDAEPYDLTSLFEILFQHKTPWEVYIRVLWQLYGHEIEEEIKVDENLPLTNFQKHGVARAIRLIREMGGVIVADEVGLGKSFIAGEILQIYRQRRQRALLICPASLRDSTWDDFFSKYQAYCEAVSFEELASDYQLADPNTSTNGKKKLKRDLSEYQLVIVDEAHNYRNPSTPSRAMVLKRLLSGKKRDVVLITATPVNNSLWDLYQLIQYFLPQDGYLANRGIYSIRGQFNRATREDPANLSPDLLYPIVDATTVKRTRQFVKNHYSGEQIRGADGKLHTINFPKPNAISIRYELDSQLPGFFDRLENALDPDSENRIKFSRYFPDRYLTDQLNTDDFAHLRGVIGLLRSGLLKRFESSLYAFNATIQTMIDEHVKFLKFLNEGYVLSTSVLKELSGDDESVFEDVFSDNSKIKSANLYRVDDLRSSVEQDLKIFKSLGDETSKVTFEQDSKLTTLKIALYEIIEQSKQNAAEMLDANHRKKVIIFSYFEDTVKWIYEYLSNQVYSDDKLSVYKNRIVTVSGSDGISNVSRDAAIRGFAPITMGTSSNDLDLYDLMIATDVLSEGVNLQQCQNIINYDLPWNPMRLVQRHGRIDRIGSPYKEVHLRTIFPVDRLDRLIQLEQRIFNKIAMAAASVGVVSPIEGAVHGDQVFSDTSDQIQKLLHEDNSLYDRGGTIGAAQTGEEYRQTLRKALESGAELIKSYPWKAGSGMIKGKRRGFFFCAVVGRGSELERTFLRFIEADDDWKPIDDESSIEVELGTCLRMIECSEDTPSWYLENSRDHAYDFWEVARENIRNAWMFQTDPKNLQPKISPLNRRVADFIYKHHPSKLENKTIDHALNILQSPWPYREHKLLQEWFNESEISSENELSNYLVRKIVETGLEAISPPELLPPIELDEINLLCWIVIEKFTEN